MILIRFGYLPEKHSSSLSFVMPDFGVVGHNMEIIFISYLIIFPSRRGSQRASRFKSKKINSLTRYEYFRPWGSTVSALWETT